MKRILCLLLLCLPLLLPSSARAQNFTSVTATNIQSISGAPLPSGAICFIATDNNNIPINFQAGGGGQVYRNGTAGCTGVFNGSIVGAFNVPNPLHTMPQGIFYHIIVQQGSVNVIDYSMVQFDSSTFNFDLYAPGAPPVVPFNGGTINGSLTVSGDLSVTGSASLNNATCSGTCTGFGGGGSGGGGVNAQSGTTYTAVLGDSGKNIPFTNSGASTLTLPGTSPSAAWFIATQSVGAGGLTIARNGRTIDGAAANISLTQGQGLFIYSDGTNYWTTRGTGGGGGGGSPGGTNGQIQYNNSGAFGGYTTVPCANQPALTGDVTTTAGSCAVGIATNAVTTPKINNGAVTEGKIGLSNVTTGNASTLAHGFVPILPNNTNVFNGQGNFVTIPAQPVLGEITANPNCNGIANCYPVYDDGQYVTDATYVASSTTVTTPSTDPPFCDGGTYACAAWQIARGHTTDIGTVEFGTYNCNGANEAQCIYNCPQGTITGVNNAHSVTVSIACTHNSTEGGTPNSDNFIWGRDDATQLATAYAALFPSNNNGPLTLQLPCGVMLIGSPAMVTRPAGSIQNAIGVAGCGPGNASMIVALPKLSCNTAHGCLLSDTFAQDEEGNIGFSDHFRDLFFWGGGTDVPDGSATYTDNSSGVWVNGAAELQNVYVEGWVSQITNTTHIFGITCVGCSMFASGSYAGGNYSCRIGSFLGIPANIFGGSCGGGQYTGMTILASSAGLNVNSYGVYFNCPYSGTYTSSIGYGVYNAAGLWSDHGSYIGCGLWNDTGGTSKLIGSRLTGQSTTYDLNLAGGRVDLTDVTTGTNANLTGGTLYIHGGNTQPSLFPTGTTITSASVLYDPQTIGSDTQLAKAAAQSAKTIFTVGALTAEFSMHISVECTTTSASATVTPSIIYTDTSGTVQTIAGSAATCTTLGAASNVNEDLTFRAKTATVVQYSTAIANTPTYDVTVTLQQLSLN